MKRLLLLISICFGLSNCKSSNKKVQWDDATIDQTICKDSTYVQLDKETEIFSAFEDQDTSKKRTSGVKYFIGRVMNPGEYKNPQPNNCRAYLHSDTLSINIGIGTGFGGHGFMIKYSNQIFYTEPYFSTDVFNMGELQPTYKIVYQKLTLDKSSYKFEDSLYGRIDFKAIEIQEDTTIEHLGKGNFRTKIGKL